MTSDASLDFLYREPKALGGRRVFRLGLAANYGIDETSIRSAFERGINYVFYTNYKSGQLRPPLREALRRDREKIVLAGVTTLGWFGGSVRRAAEKVLAELGTDYLDVFQLGWLGVASAWTEGTLRELEHLKSSGKVRALEVSIHDRVRAGRLAADSPLDLLMIRYNAAHPGAERDIFPHLGKRPDGSSPMIVAYTATSWRKLLRAPRGWDGPTMTAGDCYRFCLSSPHVDVVLTGPASARELHENLAALAKGPLTPEEDRWMREYGRRVHG